MSEKADLLYGVPAIAVYLNMRERQARTLCENGTIPTFRLVDAVKSAKRAKKRIICAKRSEVDAWINSRAAASAAAVECEAD